MSENNEKSNANKKENETDNFDIIKAVVIALVGMIILPFFLDFFGNRLNINDGEYFSINTLSSEEREGKTYTERTTFDDSDLWETEASENSQTTYVVSLTEEWIDLKEVVKFPIDINLATAEELMFIEGIGTVTAENIINYRNMYGYFSDYKQLLNINGIGEKKLANLMNYIYISDEWLETTAAAVEQSEITVLTSVPIKQEELVETVTVSKVVTVTEDIVIVNENFVFDSEETDIDYEYELESINTTYYVNFPLELNSATVEDLMFIEGIGEYTALKIVDYARNYGFYSVDELLNVDGIGNSKLAVIMPYVYVDSYMLPPKEETTFTESETITEIIIQKVNVNTCGKYELMQLPGIDEAMADKIIEFRETIGGYLKIEELTLVDGMTNEKMSAIWDYVYI